MTEAPKPCDCVKCEERESIEKVLKNEVEYQMKKAYGNKFAAYTVFVLKQILDGIKQ